MSERKIVDYRVEFDFSTTELENCVIKKIKEGYVPIGGICVTDSIMLDQKTTWYNQAMVKYEDS